MSSSPSDTSAVGQLVDVPLPKIGTSVAEGTLVAWSVDIGDPIEAGSTVCEISTDKIDSECPAPVSGVLVEVLVQVGETVDVGTVLGRIAAGDATSTSPVPSSGDDGAAAPSAPPTPPPRTTLPGSASGRGFSPVVLRTASEHNIDLSTVPGTGSGGRVTKKDVLAVVARAAETSEERPLHSDSPYRPDPPHPAVPPTAHAKATDDLGGRPESLSIMRQRIGAAMRTSQDTAATCHTIVECDMSRIEAYRRRAGLTALPIVARATIDTLREYGELNATLDGTTITRFERIHLGIAVSLGNDGLIVPVIHDAQNLSPEGLSARIKDLAGRARAKQLTPDDVRGATFTITNPGAFGASIATPVINVPQVAILDLEAVVRRPVVVTDDKGNESFAIRSMVNLVLGWDHRAIDGIYAAQFLSSLRDRLQAPRS